MSADDPESMKQGRCDFLFYNEAQLMSPRAIKNGLYWRPWNLEGYGGVAGFRRDGSPFPEGTLR